MTATDLTIDIIGLLIIYAIVKLIEYAYKREHEGEYERHAELRRQRRLSSWKPRRKFSPMAHYINCDDPPKKTKT